ncbi:MAG: aspartate-semialdehyde dehydrogenase [Spirochaetales bacterium]|jgi:aspartate-semialdehyde dehydrogenase|nr:aspartate-semialdehyde dehydrogenase [Spirochaetales bacterium]
MDRKLRAGIVGATGMVGQRFITLLADHPWFEISCLAASKRSAGKSYSEAVQGRWVMPVPIPDGVAGQPVLDASDVDAVSEKVDFIFCAVDMPKDEIRALEERFARAETPVVSNNSAHRYTPDVPMVIPEINIGHFALIEAQRRRLGTPRGFITAKPNCSIQSYVPALHPLRSFGVKQVVVSTYQAISGAGKTFESMPEIIDNVIPYIGGEEEKSEQEPLKIWGKIHDGEITAAAEPAITSQCVRVPVTDGHLAAVFVSFGDKPDMAEMISTWRDWVPEPQKRGLPSAPTPFITYFEEPDRPQTKLDRDAGSGMGITIGRLRDDLIFDYRFICLSHNTLRGAAGGAVLMAESLVSEGYLTAK